MFHLNPPSLAATLSGSFAQPRHKLISPGHQSILSVSVERSHRPAGGKSPDVLPLLGSACLMRNIWSFEGTRQNSMLQPFRCSCKHLKGERRFHLWGKDDRWVQLHVSAQFRARVRPPDAMAAILTFNAASVNPDVKSQWRWLIVRLWGGNVSSQDYLPFFFFIVSKSPKRSCNLPF